MNFADRASWTPSVVVLTCAISSTVVFGDYTSEPFNRVLQRFVDPDGRVDYVAIARDRSDLDVFIATIAETSPDIRPNEFPAEESQLAYWINAYNATVINLVVEHYPISSVKDVPSKGAGKLLSKLAGFFFEQKFELGGRTINLYGLEKNIIRKRFSDPRFHFALNCASLGCPRLPMRAFSADDLEAELERETRLFMNEDRNVRIDNESRTVWLSSIFKWYKKEFISYLKANDPKEHASLIRYAELYCIGEKANALAEARRTGYHFDFIPYDWGLNGLGK